LKKKRVYLSDGARKKTKIQEGFGNLFFPDWMEGETRGRQKKSRENQIQFTQRGVLQKGSLLHDQGMEGKERPVEGNCITAETMPL